MLVRLAPVLICLNMLDTSTLLCNCFFLFCISGAYTRRENHKRYCSFGRPVLCFRGSRRSVTTFCCVFAASRNLVRPCSALGFFWAVPRHDLLCFFMSGTDFLIFGTPAVLFFRVSDPQGHIFVPACATRTPTRRKIESPS